MEHFVGVLRLPYVLGCLVWALVLTTLAIVIVPPANLPVTSVLGTFLAFYLFYFPRYARTKLDMFQRTILRLLPKGDEEFRDLFGRISILRDQIILWIVVSALFFIALFGSPGPSPVQTVLPGGTALAVVLGSITTAAYALPLSQLVWIFYGFSRGVHRMGGSALQLQPYYKDRWLGLKPVGAISLSMGTGYFVIVGTFLVLDLISPQPPGFSLLFLGLVALGVGLFFLPSTKLHQRMVERKELEMASLNNQLDMAFQKGGGGDAQTNAYQLRFLEMTEKKVNSIATWPFDAGIVARLSGIILSVIAILLSAAIRTILKF